PVTTTSSISSDAGANTISICVRPATFSSCAKKPTDEITSTALPGAVMRYTPTASVVVARLVPFTVTLTPGNGCPTSLLTVPLMEISLSCATSSSGCANDTAKKKNKNG